jgi:hypothetical protein
MSIVRAERVDFQIAPGVFLELYRLPDGEKRIGKTSAAIVCGHKKNYFSRLPLNAPKHLEALRGMGFDGYTRPVMIERGSVGGRGSAKAETLSLDDFKRFAEFSAFDLEKPPAKAIARAFFGVTIETIAKQAFGEEALTLADIRAIVCKEYAKTINWLVEDRDDAREIDQHLLFLSVG